ncbi:hypothetical protein OIO90_001606 [Microbotryomycetes sp. JL221]|nr:hypothetical protein OIO90_001606 [Microbotryomycetes sp. JL221]
MLLINRTSITLIVERAHVPLSGSIQFTNVESGQYLLQFKSTRLKFHTYAIAVKEQDVRATVHVPGVGDAPGAFVGNTLHVQPLGRVMYSSKKQSFNPIAMFKSNPMFLLLAVAALSLVLMPKLLELLDPELVSEVQQNQAEMHSKLASFGNFDVAKMLSSSEAAPPPTASASSTKKHKRR